MPTRKYAGAFSRMRRYSSRSDSLLCWAFANFGKVLHIKCWVGLNVASLNCQLEKALESFEFTVYRRPFDRTVGPVFQRLLASEIPVLANAVTSKYP